MLHASFQMHRQQRIMLVEYCCRQCVLSRNVVWTCSRFVVWFALKVLLHVRPLHLLLADEFRPPLNGQSFGPPIFYVV